MGNPKAALELIIKKLEDVDKVLIHHLFSRLSSYTSLYWPDVYAHMTIDLYASIIQRRP